MPLPGNRPPKKRRLTQCLRQSPPTQHRNLRPRLPLPAMDGPANGPRNSNLTSDEVILRLKKIKGPTPSCITNFVTDHANDLMYFIDAREDIGVSYLWVLKIDTMRWEHIPITHHAPNPFTEDQEELPYRVRPSPGIWGPKNHRRLLLFGGENIDGEKTTDFFSVDLVTKIWTRVAIQDGALQGYDDMVATFEEGQLCLFGIYEQEDRPNTFSIAECNAAGAWTWKCLAKVLPPALHNIVNIYAAPLSHRNKLLLVGCSKRHTEIIAELIFTFDLLDHTFTQEDAAGEPPSSTTMFIVEPARDKVIFSTEKQDVHYIWIYEAHPFNRWKSVIPIGPCEVLESYGVVVLRGRSYVLLGDQRIADFGLNAYMEIDDLVEEMQD